MSAPITVDLHANEDWVCTNHRPSAEPPGKVLPLWWVKMDAESCRVH
jgi:hypothetical protein